jgi:Uma2 family endonuclease
MSIAADAKAIRLGPYANGMELSADEFDAVTEWDPACRYELLHGVVIVSPIPAEGEADPNGELEYLLRKYQEEHPPGAALDKTLPERYIHLEDGSRRRADRVIWTGLGRRPNPKSDVPSIAIEFVSESQRDRDRDYISKRREYRNAGVVEYWMIDRFRYSMTVYLADGTEHAVAADEVYSTPLLPGFELPLRRLFSIADEWN